MEKHRYRGERQADIFGHEIIRHEEFGNIEFAQTSVPDLPKLPNFDLRSL